jgi:L-malate glycosyltransferase
VKAPLPQLLPRSEVPDRDNSALRVAFVGQTGTASGGAERSIGLLFANLPSSVDPTIILFEDGVYAEQLRRQGYTVEIVCMPNAVMRQRRESIGVAGAVLLPLAIVRLARRLRNRGFDVVHTNAMKAHVVGGPAAMLAGIPAVMHVREILEGRALRIFRFVSGRFAFHRIACSGAVAHSLQVPATTVILNPISPRAYADDLPSRAEARSALNLPQDDPVIGIVGRINRCKGQDRFLRIIAKVNERTPVHAAIIGESRFGDEDFLPELRELAVTLGIADRTTFIPWQEDPRLAYRALDVHCNCAQREPFGRVILEAAAAGVPTISFDDGGAPEIITDGVTGRLISADDESAFVRAVEAYVRDLALAKRHGDAAREDSRRFDAADHTRAVVATLRGAARRVRS